MLTRQVYSGNNLYIESFPFIISVFEILQHVNSIFVFRELESYAKSVKIKLNPIPCLKIRTAHFYRFYLDSSLADNTLDLITRLIET